MKLSIVKILTEGKKDSDKLKQILVILNSKNYTTADFNQLQKMISAVGYNLRNPQEGGFVSGILSGLFQQDGDEYGDPDAFQSGLMFFHNPKEYINSVVEHETEEEARLAYAKNPKSFYDND